jgi:hypothetical protein
MVGLSPTFITAHKDLTIEIPDVAVDETAAL